MKKILLILAILIAQYSYGQFFRSHSYGKGDCTLSIKTNSSTGQTLQVAVNNTGGKKIISVGILVGFNSNMTLKAYNWDAWYSGNFNTGEAVTYSDNFTFAAGSSHYMRGIFLTPIDTIYGNTVYLTVPGGSYPPSVEIVAISNITSSSASSGGNYLTDNGSAITSKGVQWSIYSDFSTIAGSTNNGTGTANFISSITGLNPNTLYYVRAYATNAYGTSYSGRLSFTTSASGTTPIVVTNTISSITENSAVSGGVITSDGNATIIEKGLCYKIGSTPISTDNTINSGSGSASWVTNITGLSPNTEYHVRAWARNSYVVNGFTVMALGYGQEEIFTTLPSTAILPTLATISASPIQSTYAFSGGTITGAGTNLITDRGVCYGTSTNPTISNSFVSSGVGQTGSYSTYLSPLNPSTLYYARAYATTIDGTAYGNQISFTTTATSCTVPVLATNSITSITTNSATSGGVISSDGGCSITSKGVQWSLDYGFSTIAGSTSNGTGTGSFTSSITGLNCGTTYYVRAYATNTAGTGYGSTVSFITNSSATVSIASFSAVTSTSFTANCSVTSSCSNITSRGIIYSTSSGVTYPTNAQACGSGTGTYDCTPYATLSPSTTYYVKSYVIVNGSAIYLSLESTVTTLAIPPVDPCTLSVGDSYGGGIVAYIFQSGDPGYISGQCHGIIAATSDQSTSAYFGCYGSNLSGASSILLKGGEQNTIDIVTGCSDSGISARLCYDYSSGSYSDWWLPSLNELIKLYQNRALIGGFDTTKAYSSSSEVDAYSVYSLDFSNGSYAPGSNTKLFPFNIRAIRYF